MALVDQLLSTAYEDTQLLKRNDELGDDFSVPREVDFVFLSGERKNAEVLASFVGDNQYGKASIEQSKEGFRVVVSVTMPTNQQVLCSVSALMVCLAQLFSLEYDGWGCVIQRRT